MKSAAGSQRVSDRSSPFAKARSRMWSRAKQAHATKNTKPAIRLSLTIIQSTTVFQCAHSIASPFCVSPASPAHLHRCITISPTRPERCPRSLRLLDHFTVLEHLTRCQSPIHLVRARLRNCFPVVVTQTVLDVRTYTTVTMASMRRCSAMTARHTVNP